MSHIRIPINGGTLQDVVRALIPRANPSTVLKRVSAGLHWAAVDLAESTRVDDARDARLVSAVAKQLLIISEQVRAVEDTLYLVDATMPAPPNPPTEIVWQDLIAEVIGTDPKETP